MCKLVCGNTAKIERIHSYYEQNFENANENYKILGWENPDAHYLRFSVFNDNLALSNRSLLDVGCGLGDLYRFLTQIKKISLEYLGLDISPRMIEEARKQNPSASFACEDVFASPTVLQGRKFDVVYSSGIFNLALGNNMDFLSKALTVFNDLATQAFAFTLLSQSSQQKEETFFYYSPDEVEQLLAPLCLKEIRIIEGYLPNDFTVICVKEK